MKNKKLLSLAILFLSFILILSGCSGGTDGSNSNDELILKSLDALNSETIEATFSDGTNYETRDFDSEKEYLTSEKQEVSFLYEGITYNGTVSYEGTEFVGTISDSSSSSLSSKIINKFDFITQTAFAQSNFPIVEKENIIVNAVGPNGTSYTVDTTSNGKFNLKVQNGDPFILILTNTAGEFIGLLKDNNGNTIEIKASDNINDIGEITIDTSKLTPSNLNNINKSTTNIDKLDDIEYTNPDSINSTLFFPSEDNAVSILAERDGFNVTLGKLGYSDQLNKPIYIEGTFYYEGNPTDSSEFTLQREDYFYYENQSKYLWKYKEYKDDGTLDTTATPNDIIMPALFEKGKVYTANVYGNEASYTFDSTKDQFEFNGNTHNREIIKINLDTIKGTRSSYYAKGIGFVGYENTEGNADEVKYARAGDNSVGTKPEWLKLDSNLKDDLKSKFGN